MRDEDRPEGGDMWSCSSSFVILVQYLDSEVKGKEKTKEEK